MQLILLIFIVTLLAAVASGSRYGSSLDSAVPDESLAVNNKSRVLLFWAVGSAPRTMDVVRRGVAKMRKTAGEDCCDLFLAHYDGAQGLSRWRDADPTWYQTEVAQSETVSGFKFAILRDIYKKYGSDQWPAKYAFVWALDEDIDLSATDGGLALELATSSKALIVGPSLRQNGGRITWKVQVPNPSCIFRYTNYVEVIAPIIRVSALQAVLVDCAHCIHDKTAWGLDDVWCNFLAEEFHMEVGSTCAILDATPVLHQNFKTLAGKYDARNHVNMNFRDNGLNDQQDTEKRYPELYVREKDMGTLKCVTKYGRYQAGEPVNKRLSSSIDKLAQSAGVVEERIAVPDPSAKKHHHNKDGKKSGGKHEHLRHAKSHHKSDAHMHESKAHM